MNKNILKSVCFAALFFSVSVFAQSPRVDQPVLSKILDGKSYYHLTKGKTCQANDPERTVIKSWSNKVSFKGGQILVWGSVCNDSPELILFSDVKNDLFVSSDLRIIVYKKEVLVLYGDEPKLCPAGQWCPLGDGQP